MIVILLTVALAILFYYYIVKPFYYWKELGVKQGKPVWVLGDVWKHTLRLQTASDMVVEFYNKFPGVRYMGIYQFFHPTLVIRDLELIKQLAIKDFEHFGDHRNFIPEEVDPLWGKNILMLPGKRWRDMRSLLTPSFTVSKLKATFGLIKECTEHIVDHLLKKHQDVYNIEAKDFFTRITTDLIATTSYGINVDSLAQPRNQFYMMGQQLTNFSSPRATLLQLATLVFENFFKVFKIPFYNKELTDYFRDLINDNIRIREDNGIERPDLINEMVQARKGAQKNQNGVSKEQNTKKHLANITNEDIVSQAMLLFFGGFESVSSVMSFMVYELATHQDIQERLRKEIYDTQEECGGTVTYDAISNMKYMDMVFSEVLRKWPNFVMTDRVCTKDYVIEPTTPDEKPLHLKKGSSIVIPIYAIHHDPKYYPHPERFDPERFSDENKGMLNPSAYLSFGIGPRNCIGSRFAAIESKTVMFYLLSNFELVPVENTDIPVRVSKKDFNLQPAGVRLGLKRIVKAEL